tara:strand:- start:1113 stop:1301 length:189 start_codon:yes stop_codon:yes gene_type:complete
MNKIVTTSLAPVIDWLKTYLRNTRTRVMEKTKKRNPTSNFSIYLVRVLKLFFFELIIRYLPC